MQGKNAIRRAIFDAIRSFARPGDVCFFITIDPEAYQKLSWFERKYRKWMGFSPEDISVWHTGILSKFEKMHRNAVIRPYIIHSTIEKGVFEQHISPGYFSSQNIAGGQSEGRTIMEILRYQGLTSDQNEQLVEFCRQQIGRPFPKSTRGEFLTYLLGLPNIFNSSREFSCDTLIYAAFDHIGVHFPHHLDATPFTNIAHYLGHPLLHQADRANIHYPYLRDHHIYRDSRFQTVLFLTLDLSTKEILLRPSPKKYSWDPHIAEVFQPS